MSNKKEKFTRYEFKYILDPITYYKVKNFVESIGLDHDKNTSSNPYTVTSLYFDSVGLDDYYDKAGGFIKRKKVRIRIYANNFKNNTEVIYFEVKNKYDMFISKDRALVSKEDWNKIVEGDFSKLPKSFNYYISEEGRIPTVIVRYEREAFDSWFKDRVRLTFDKNIEAIKPDTFANINGLWYDTISVSGPLIVLEIKFAESLPWWFGLMIKKFDLKRATYSKYAHAIDALYSYDPLPR